MDGGWKDVKIVDTGASVESWTRLASHHHCELQVDCARKIALAFTVDTSENHLQGMKFYIQELMTLKSSSSDNAIMIRRVARSSFSCIAFN